MGPHFWADLTIGQVLSVVSTFGTLLVLWFSGRAARNARQGVRLVRRLIASVGLLPEDQAHRQGQTLTAQFTNLAEQVARLEATARAGKRPQEQHDEPPVRDRDENAVEAWRHGHRTEARGGSDLGGARLRAAHDPRGVRGEGAGAAR